MPIHYALTDALVALVAIWGAWRLVRTHKTIAAFGLALFGLAGVIGTIRITGGLIEPLAAVHKMASQLGGLAGLSLLLCQILHDTGWRVGKRVSFSAAVLVAAVGAIFPMAGAVLFGVMLVVALAFFLKVRSPTAAIGFALMLINIVFVRQSAFLGPDASWHLYHVLVAAWLGCVAWTMSAPSPSRLRS